MKLLGIVDADPFHERTWSGSSPYLFSTLQSQGALLGAEGAKLEKSTDTWRKVVNFRPDMARWKFQYHIDPGTAAARSRAGWRNLSRYPAADYDALLQIGAFYDFTGYAKRPIVTYHDGNLALRLRSPFGYPDVGGRVIRNALAFEKRVYEGTRLMLTMSRWLADSFTKDFGIPARKVVPVYAGVNLPKIADTTGRDYANREVLIVGREFERKGGDLLLKAFAKVVKAVPDARLRIIGATIPNPPPYVICDGFVSKSTPEGLEHMLRAYSQARVFAMPSLYEPFGIAFLEAMAHRIPCIGANSCAMPEIIDHGRTGFLVEPNDVDTLAMRLEELLKDDAMCRQLGEAGYAKYRAGFTWEAVVARILDAIGHSLA